SRGQRPTRTSLAKKFAAPHHVSQTVVRDELLPTIRILFAGDEELRIHMTARLGLDEREAALLLDEPESSHAVKHLLEKAGKIKGSPPAESAGGRLSAFHEDENGLWAAGTSSRPR